MTNNKHIFVFAGLPGAGKDACAKYLAEKYAAKIFSFTTMLKDVADRFYLEFNRDNLIKISDALRSAFGENILAKTLAKDAKKSTDNFIVITNARRIADVEFLSQMPGYLLIEISANIKTRYERVKNRGEKTSDATQTFEEFVADNQRPTELSIAELAKQATEQIDNDGTLDDLHRQLDDLVAKYS